MDALENLVKMGLYALITAITVATAHLYFFNNYMPALMQQAREIERQKLLNECSPAPSKFDKKYYIHT